MDTVYGTKKYFQSLSGSSEIYRTQACNVALANDYSYQNSLGRRSQLGAYYHMNKQPTISALGRNVSNQYGYNSWGIWHDGRNIAPSTFSTKTQPYYQKNRSFSLILTTAAFIVLLAVISIAGLAFYFTSIKANIEDPILGFEGTFQIAKGDLFSTGLKYNHTTTYKQKIDFYKRFVERALMDNGLQTMRTDVWGFGDGPLIKVFFRVFLDVRKLPQNIHSVEEYIKESLFLETSSAKSLYRSLRIDVESMEIKRIMDEHVVRSATVIKEAQMVPTSQSQFEKRLIKKGDSALNLPTKHSSKNLTKQRTTERPNGDNDEPELDVENAPVIQGSFEGSFEITKTDADIARKKATPTRAYLSSSLPPKTMPPVSLRVKPKKPGIDKFTTILPQQNQYTSTTTTVATTTKTTTPATTTTSSTITTTTSAPKTTTTPSTTTTTTTTSSTPLPTSTTATKIDSSSSYSTLDAFKPTVAVPKLDANLFTTIPILDTQPWRPIHREVPEFLPGPPPAFPTKALQTSNIADAPPPQASPIPIEQNMPQRRIDEFELPFIPENPMPPHMPTFDSFSLNFMGNNGKASRDKNATILYHSFGNPVFMPNTENIERLGAGAYVQPHPLPVPLIDDVVIPAFKPLQPTFGTMEKLPFNIDANDDKFEHLGGGVIVKKVDNSTSQKSNSFAPTSTEADFISSTLPSRERIENTTVVNSYAVKPTDTSELADTIGEFFMELLNLSKEDNITRSKNNLESRISAEESQNIKPQVSSSTSTTTTTTIRPRTTTTAQPVTKPNFLNIKEIILKRKQESNSTKKLNKSTAKPPIIKPTTEESKKDFVRSTSSRPSVILDDSSLFPSHSKWEFVNSSSSNLNYGNSGTMRKVFNKTLQAFISEDIRKSENFTLNDIKTRINNATNIQDISLIFDNLASKLGITPSVPTKVPPFSQNKLKQAQKNETWSKPTTEFKATTEVSLITTTTYKTTTQEPTKKFIELPLKHRESILKPISAFFDDTDASYEGVGAAIPVVGEAEVEMIDPNKYEEMLQSSQFADFTTTESSIHKLVTLLPVRSNSGIRQYPVEPSDAGKLLKSNEQSRRLGQTPAEAIVKSGLKVTEN